MNVEIGTEAVQFPEKEYLNGIFLAVRWRLFAFFQKFMKIFATQGGKGEKCFNRRFVHNLFRYFWVAVYTYFLLHTVFKVLKFKG